MRGKRTRVARGVSRDASGYSVRWHDGGARREKRFPPDTPLADLKEYYRQRVSRAATAKHRAKTGGFVRDAVRFLRSRRGRPCFKSDRSHLRAWIHRLGPISRFSIIAETIREALNDWTRDGYSPQEVRHRWRILHQFFTTLDPTSPNPCKEVSPPRKVKRRPRSVPDALVTEVAINLRKSEICRRLRSPKTRARFLVLATTGQRPAQLRRARRHDVDFEQRIWFVDPAKGDEGTSLYLNDEMLAAWRLYADANAWGQYNQRSFVKTLQRNGWPRGIRPYNLRHTVGISLSELGADLGDIQAHMGHSSPATTRSFYVPKLAERQRVTSGRLEGRLKPAAFGR